MTGRRHRGRRLSYLGGARSFLIRNIYDTQGNEGSSRTDHNKQGRDILFSADRKYRPASDKINAPLPPRRPLSVASKMCILNWPCGLFFRPRYIIVFGII